MLLSMASAPAFGREIRVATYNVEHGIGESGTAKGDAQRAILRRVNADIVAFQELNRRTHAAWIRLAGELGYPQLAAGEMGPFAGGMLVGFFSRFPIVESVAVVSPEGAREFSRFPLRATIAIPGAARPLTLWNMHHKALFRRVDDFRRAVEAYRIVQDIERTVAAHPDRTEWILLGDMNDDEHRGLHPDHEPQSKGFNTVPEGLPRSFMLGNDIPFPLLYRAFPLDTYLHASPGFVAVNAVREGTHRMITHRYTGLRLDYVFVSEAIRNHPGGPPRGEVYHSDWETGAGLRKAGARPAEGTTDIASDHYVVFVDLHVEASPAATP